MKTLAVLVLMVFLAMPAIPQVSGKVPRGFRTDGCTFFPDCDYRDCCVEHDKTYYVGGSLKERREADNRLFKCVGAKGGKRHKIMAPLIWVGVRVGGVSFLPTPFRWGFGHKFPRKEP